MGRTPHDAFLTLTEQFLEPRSNQTTRESGSASLLKQMRSLKMKEMINHTGEEEVPHTPSLLTGTFPTYSETSRVPAKRER